MPHTTTPARNKNPYSTKTKKPASQRAPIIFDKLRVTINVTINTYTTQALTDQSILLNLPLGGTCSPKEGLSNAQAHKQKARLKSQAL